MILPYFVNSPNIGFASTGWFFWMGNRLIISGACRCLAEINRKESVLTAKTPRAAVLPIRCVSALLFSVLMASCTATPNDPTLGLAVNPSVEQPMARSASLAGEQDAFIQTTAPTPTPAQAAEPASTSQTDASAAESIPLPSAVAFAANEKPSAAPIAGFDKAADGAPSLASATLTVPAAQPKPPVQEQTRTAEVPSSQVSNEAPAQQVVATAVPAAASAPETSLPGTSIENRVGNAHGGASPAVAARPVATASAQTPDQKRGFLSAFFSANQSNGAPAPIREAAHAPMIAQKTAKTPVEAQARSEPLVQMASLSSSDGSAGSERASLPGVRTTALFEISTLR